MSLPETSVSKNLLSPAEFRERLEAAGVTHQVADKPRRYLLRPQVEELLGLAHESLRHYRLPPPDALIGARPMMAWAEDTILAWDATRRSKRIVR